MSSSKKLIIVGGGSAAFAAAIEAVELGAQVTMINDGLPLGGTCVNVGCVPSKTLLRAAEAYFRPSHHIFSGIELSSRLADFSKIIEQKRELVAEMRQAKYVDIAAELPNLEIIEGRAGLIGKQKVAVNEQVLEADRIIIATGASPAVPPIPGLGQSRYLTNESAFELEKLPKSLIVLGGRAVALEIAQLFLRFGSKVTMLQRSKRILPQEGPDLTEALAGYLSSEGMKIVKGVSLDSVIRDGGQVTVKARVDGKVAEFKAEHILVALGRKPNTDGLGLEEVGISLNKDHSLGVDDYLQTNITGVFGAGDVVGPYQFVYTAAYEGKLAAENALTGPKRKRNYRALPWVVFTDPQVAGVGLDENQAKEQGIEPEASVLPLNKVPRSVAARDTRGFIKLIRNKVNDKIIGARILAPEGSELLMEIGLAIKYGVTAEEIASSFHPYLTLSEGVKLAALGFEKDIDKLSCCAD